MSSNLASMQHHNKRLVNFCISKAYPDGVITLERLIDDNLISGSQVAELAVCRTNGIVGIHPIGVGRDLTDDSDVKTVTVVEFKSKTWLFKNKIKTEVFNIQLTREAPVCEIKNKVGKLRIIAYNPFNESWNFFVIPNDIYSHLKCIKIRYSRETNLPTGMYAKYEVPSWDDLCKL